MVGLDVHGRQLPDFAAIVDTALEAPLLFLGTDFEPVLQQDDAGIDHGALKHWRRFEKSFGLFLAAESHHPLDTSAVIPTAIENHDLSRSRKMLDVALDIDLALLALRRRRQGDNAKDARTYPLGYRLDGATLAGPVASLKNNA